MKRVIIGAALGCALTVATAVPANAQTVLYLGGTGDPFAPTQAQMAFLRHEWASADDPLVGIAYPASLIGITLSVDIGVNDVSQAMNATGSPETPLGLSGSPSDTKVVIKQYDGFADFPDRPLNLLATANALLGIVFVHPNYDVDLSTVPKGDITEVTNSLGGKTTTYMVPSEHLPLTDPLRMIGVDGRLVDQLDKLLRPIIDSAYNDLPERATTTPEAPQQTSDDSHTQVDPSDSVASGKPKPKPSGKQPKLKSSGSPKATSHSKSGRPAGKHHKH